MDAPDAYRCEVLPDTSPTGILLCSLSFRHTHTALPQLLYITDPRQLNFMAAKICSLQSVTLTTCSPFYFFFFFLFLKFCLYFSPLSPCIIHKCVNLAHVRCLAWFRRHLGIWESYTWERVGFNYLYQLHYLDSYQIEAHGALENYLHFSLYMLKRKIRLKWTKATCKAGKMFINQISE